MTKYVRILCLSVLLGLLSTNLLADGVPPSGEEVCDVLQLEGVTPGLYGLCNAYCEAKDCDSYGPYEDQPRSCQRLFDNYERMRERANNPLDPEMPCLAEESVVCPCWPPESGRVADGGMGLPAAFCLTDTPGGPVSTDAVFYDDFQGTNMISFTAGMGAVPNAPNDEGCQYLNGMSMEMDEVLTTPDEQAVCRAGVAQLRDEDFQDLSCVLLP